MPPIQGHLMVPKAMRILKFAVAQAKTLIRTTPTTAKQTYTSLNPIRAYTQKTIAIHPNALLKQSKSSRLQSHGSRSYSSAHHPTSQARGPKYDRSTFPTSRTSRTIARNGSAPFASTLRPNLTGGTLPRSAGGYGLGGAGRARQFSHTSGCQAQVVQNVSAGIRAFLVNGSKARFDGVDPVTGEKHWRTVTETQNEMYKKWSATPYSSPRGTSLDFQLCPTVTALLSSSSSSSSISSGESPTSSPAEHEPSTLNSTGVLRALSSDFARAFRDLALVTHDLSKLATLGDLPLSLIHTPSGPLLRVRFPGCDADTVSALCDEVDIRRGVIVEDPSWAQSRDADMALLFPFAPMEHSYSESESDLDGLADYGREYFVRPGRKLKNSESGNGGELISTLHSQALTPSISSSQPEEDYTSFISDISASEGFPTLLPSSYASIALSSASHTSHRHGDSHSLTETEPEMETAQYEGVEGIYRFLQEIEDARR